MNTPKATLNFSGNGRTVSIRFKNGSESLEFESKEEAIFAITECAKIGKITKEEARDFLKEITLAENLPDHDRTISLLPLLFLSALLSSGIDEDREEETQDREYKITDPYIQMCTCNKKKRPHAYIHNGNGDIISPLFQFRSDGLDFVSRLLETDRITEGDSAGLNTQIHLLTLPESPILN
jgi:hypothetical protein